jgi:uncharacterized membrane protein YdbT with pleckstrin-like domain
MEQQEYKWTGRPDYTPFLMQQVIEMAGMVVFLLCIYAFYYLIQDTSGEIVSRTLLHVVFGFVFLRQAYFSLKKLIEYRYLCYRITDDKVEIIKGKNQEDLKIIAKDKIQFVQAKRSLGDRIYGTKTIKLYSGEVTSRNDEPEKKLDELENIKEEKEVMLLLSK